MENSTPAPTARRRFKHAAPILAAFAFVLCWVGEARAGYAIEPASGSTIGPRPTFLVYLEPHELSLARVYVAASPEMTTYGWPLKELGSCTPSTPFPETNKYTCQPAYYSPNYTSTLPPGTYYWWLTFYRTDPGKLFATLHVSGPLQITVAQPTAPANARIVAPAEGATVSLPPTFTIHAPGSATIHIYVALSTDRQDDGSPVGLTLFHCSGPTVSEDDYYCTVSDTSLLVPGSTYYWWAVIDVGDSAWIYGPRSFTVRDPYSGSGGSAGSGGSGRSAREMTDAAYLPRSAHFTGRSVKHTRLSAASYWLTKIVGFPKSIAVACWNGTDWPNVSGDSGDGVYAALAFYSPLMPHWVHLSPTVCRAIQTLLYHRPQYANRFTANAVETVTHEMMHAIGIVNEAMAECFGMQLSNLLAVRLGIPSRYADSLARYNLVNYAARPPRYRDPYRCREDGAWDIFKGRPSPPWHSYRG